MKVVRRVPLLLLLLMLAPAHGHALSWELGVLGGAGISLTSGSFLDSKEATLAEVGSSTPGKLGSSKRDLFPGWTAGGYVEAGILDWFGLRAELRASFMGASGLALTDTGDPFDRYGYYFYDISLLVLARFKVACGPGFFCFSAGPFLALTIGGLTILDRYASSTTTATVDSAFFFGLAGGVGYAMALGPGICALEARADWAITSAAANDKLGGDIFPLGLNIVLSYGFPLGGGGK
jgi:hypothetical protein